jgi:glycosyltransferase involved in cell wall biosynthesis
VTTTLRVIVDDILAPAAALTTGAGTGTARYAEELTRGLILTAPAGCVVEGIVSSSPAEEYESLLERLPGLEGLKKSALGRRELHAAWQHGLSRPSAGGMVHAPSLLAPLLRHDRVHNRGDQTVVTVHDLLTFTHPGAIGHRDATWQKAMLKRAHRFADAVVVPTHALAAQLDAQMNFGDRIRVIGGAVASSLLLPPDADARAAALELPDRFILATGTLNDLDGLGVLIQSLASDADAGFPLLVSGARTAATDAALAGAASAAGLATGRVRSIGALTDEDRAVAVSRAEVFAYPRRAGDFALPVLEAFFFGTPVVHSDDAGVVEVSAGAGIAVPALDPSGTTAASDRWAEALASVFTDGETARRYGYSGLDRARAFTWPDAAQRIWQLHADL